MPPRQTILVVEDDEDILELIAYNLEQAGWQVARAETGEDALQVLTDNAPNLIILDLMLPGMDGLEVCRRIKSESRTCGIPVIMVTARGEEPDVVAGLELGADDYVSKPFRPRELVARVRAVLRRGSRSGSLSDGVVRIFELEIDPGRHELKVDGKQVDLTYTEFRVLQVLAQRPGWVFTRYQIVDAVRGDDYPVTDRSVDVQVVGLRKKLGKAGKYIETVRGIGYRFKDPG
jgi:two-component system alkaline phosphatase synthesis response regulator PhoP